MEFVTRLDAALFAWVVAHRVGALNNVMRGVSIFGIDGIGWLILGGALTLTRRLPPRGLLQLTLAVVVAVVLADHVIKPIVHRERPFVRTATVQVIGAPPRDASFPSGHASAAFAGALVLARFIPALRVLWWGLAAAIGWSRIYLGVHYPMDIVGGAIVGLACGTVCCLRRLHR